jgi:hypothetical protein
MRIFKSQKQPKQASSDSPPGISYAIDAKD